MLSYPDGTFVPIAIATHGLVGLTLGAVLFDRPVVGLFAGVIPDADFLLPSTLPYPVVHRGITHTLVILFFVVAFLTVLAKSDIVGAVGVCYGSHLLIDVTTPKGVPLVYPLVPERLYLDAGVGGHAPSITVVLWLVCLGLIGYRLQTRDSVTDTELNPRN